MPAGKNMLVPTTKKQLQKKTALLRQEHQDRVRIDATASVQGRNDLLPHKEIVVRTISSLKPAKRRVRKTQPDQLERVIKSLQVYGLVSPVLIDPQDRIVTGHIVIEALKALGSNEVQCIVVGHLDEDLTRAFAIAHNRLGETGAWHLEELRLEFLDLSAVNLDLTLTGFTVPQIDIIKTDPDTAKADPDPNVEVAIDPVSVLGDLFQLGSHRILCGDAVALESYERLLDGKLANAVFSDPPYNCPIKGFVSGLGQHKHEDFKMAVGEMSDQQFVDFLKDYLFHCRASTSQGAVIYACMDWRQIDLLLAAGRFAGLNRINMAVWNKGSGGMGGLYRSAYELVAVFCNGATPSTNNVQLGVHGRDRTNMWNYAGANRRGSSAAAALADHPTPKPIAMVQDAILDVTDIGDLVLDPFLGSGTTLIAAENADRVCYGMELDPRYLDATIRRWEKQRGRLAIHVESGLTYAQLKALRLEEA